MMHCLDDGNKHVELHLITLLYTYTDKKSDTSSQADKWIARIYPHWPFSVKPGVTHSWERNGSRLVLPKMPHYF